MNIILLFEGPDKVGKTSLLREMIRQTYRNVCVDRFLASQFIYGRYKNKSSYPGLESIRKTEKEIIKLESTLYIYIQVCAELKDIEKRFEEHNEKDVPLYHQEMLLNEYDEFMRDTLFPVIKINTSKYRSKKGVKIAVEHIRHAVAYIKKNYAKSENTKEVRINLLNTDPIMS